MYVSVTVSENVLLSLIHIIIYKLSLTVHEHVSDLPNYENTPFRTRNVSVNENVLDLTESEIAPFRIMLCICVCKRKRIRDL